MARILFLSHRVPYPPNKGDKIRSFNEIRYLSRKHEIHLLAFCDNPEEMQYREVLKELCKTVELIPLSRWRQCLHAGFAMLRGRPWSLGYFSSSRMQRAVTGALGNRSFDLIFVYCSSMAPYALEARIPRILDFVDSDSLKWKQYSESRPAPLNWLFGYEARKLSRFELNMVDAFDHTFFVSRLEVEGRLTKDLESKVSFMQNGIDLEFFTPPSTKSEALAVAFTGAMDYYPNIDAALFFAHDIFPRIRSVYSNASFLIIGSNPGAEIQKLASVPGITVTGTVKDIRPYLAQCRAAVVPLRIAQGIQNKILEALASGLPVITTPVAAGALVSADALPITVASSPDEFARAALECLGKAPLPSAAVQACRKHLRLYYDWETNLSALDEVVERIA